MHTCRVYTTQFRRNRSLFPQSIFEYENQSFARYNNSLNPRFGGRLSWMLNHGIRTAATIFHRAFELLPAMPRLSPRGRLRRRCGRRWRGRRRTLRACLRRFRAGDFAAGADDDDDSTQQVRMEMACHALCNPKSPTLNPNSMMQADSSATMTEKVAASTQARRFRDSDPKNSVAFACYDPWCPRLRT